MQHDGLLTRREVERICKTSRSSIYCWMRRGTFPLPLKLAAKTVRWRRSEVEAWLSTRPLARGEFDEEASRSQFNAQSVGGSRVCVDVSQAKTREQEGLSR